MQLRIVIFITIWIIFILNLPNTTQLKCDHYWNFTIDENHEKRIHEIVEDCAACGYYYSNATSKGKYSGAMVGCQLSVENINGLYGYGSIKFHEYHTNCIEFGKVNSSYYVSEIFTDDENQLIFSQISCCFSDLCTREYMNMSFADSN